VSTVRNFTARNRGWIAFLQRWVVTTLAVLIAAQVISGIRYDSPAGLIAASLLLGVLNAFIRPLLLLLSAPLVVVTFGLFIVVINAALLYFVGWLIETFHVDSFWSAVGGALIISVVSLIVNSITRTGGARVQFRRRSRGPSDRDDGGGPVIDV
jgi:putative membrane protein